MLWLIDLDDTLIHASHTMFDAIHHAMNDFMVRELKLSPEQAQRRRLAYWATYGATYEGLWRHDGVDPIAFLRETHHFDVIRHLGEVPDTHDLWRLLPGKKVIYTNGPREYATTILKHIGLWDVFDGVITSSESCIHGSWHAKPSRLAIRTILKAYGTMPRDAWLVDDSLKNLQCAHACGLNTVWMTGFKREQPELLPDYLTARVTSLWSLPRVLAYGQRRHRAPVDWGLDSALE